jgi:hypothetical protein
MGGQQIVARFQCYMQQRGLVRSSSRMTDGPPWSVDGASPASLLLKPVATSSARCGAAARCQAVPHCVNHFVRGHWLSQDTGNIEGRVVAR